MKTRNLDPGPKRGTTLFRAFKVIPDKLKCKELFSNQTPMVSK